jgi:hypothetical protein
LQLLVGRWREAATNTLPQVSGLAEQLAAMQDLLDSVVGCMAGTASPASPAEQADPLQPSTSKRAAWSLGKGAGPPSRAPTPPLPGAKLPGRVTQTAAVVGGSSLDQLEGVFRRLSLERPEEYLLFNLPAAALVAALPRFQALLAGWAPLAEPGRGVAEFRRWRPLLDPANLSAAADGAVPAPMFASSLAYQQASGHSRCFLLQR